MIITFEVKWEDRYSQSIEKYKDLSWEDIEKEGVIEYFSIHEDYGEMVIEKPCFERLLKKLEIKKDNITIVDWALKNEKFVAPETRHIF